MTKEKDKHNLPKTRHRNWFRGLTNWVGHWQHTYHPFYDEHADYNTNAKSYYDYLARHSRAMAVMTGFINRLLDRNIEFHETDTVTFTKKGDWIDNGECEPNHYDDVIDITAEVKISDEVKDYTLVHYLGRFENIKNSIEVFSDGIYSPDYFPLLNAIDEELNKINEEIINIKKVQAEQGKAIQKIVDNLYKSGAITNNNINSFEFKPNRDIATGNINLFGGTADGNSFIRTSDKQTENDITAGI